MKPAGLEIWIHGRQFENAHDSWDGNRLQATAHCGARGADVWIEGPHPVGHLEILVEITPDHLTQEHKFRFEVDQSYLPGLISQCRKILSRWPARSPHP